MILAGSCDTNIALSLWSGNINQEGAPFSLPTILLQSDEEMIHLGDVWPLNTAAISVTCCRCMCGVLVIAKSVVILAQSNILPSFPAFPPSPCNLEIYLNTLFRVARIEIPNETLHVMTIYHDNLMYHYLNVSEHTTDLALKCGVILLTRTVSDIILIYY